MAGVDMTKYVTWDALAGHLEPLAEIRDMLRERMGTLEHGQETIASSVNDMKVEITERQDRQNGTLNDHGRTISALDERLGQVEHFGCAQRASDIQVMKRLAAINPVDVEVAADETIEPRAAFVRRVVNKRSATAAALVGLGMFLMWALPFIHRIFNAIGV